MHRKAFSPGAWGSSVVSLSIDARIPTTDVIRPFQVESTGLRGRFVRLGTTAATILSRHAYPPVVTRLLGEALVLSTTLAAAVKLDGVFTLQMRGDGPVSLLVADYASGEGQPGAIRGYAQFDAARLERALAGGQTPSVPRLLGNGQLVFTVDQGVKDRYQAIVALDGATMADCAHAYFRDSEQIDTAIRIAAGAAADGTWRAGCLMVQRLPEAHRGDTSEDDWRRVAMLAGSLTEQELLDDRLEPDTLLWRLFHTEGVRVYNPVAIELGCRCTRERIERVLGSFPGTEIDAMAVDGRITVNCQFCNRAFEFDPAGIPR
jgi:molecular chaperone Hsp33